MTSIISALNKGLQTDSHITRFFKRFDVSGCLKAANIRKVKGYPVLKLLQALFMLVFTHKNYHRHTSERGMAFGKDLGYRFLNNSNSDWRTFLLKLGANIINTFMDPLTSHDRPKVLIVDDSLFSRNRSKKVELLARVFDHTQHRFVKGFRKLTLGWSDGSSFIPLAFSLLSSKDSKNRLYEQGPYVPERSPGNARRKEAILSANDVLLQLLDEVLEHTKAFNYVLFDSWFSWPKVIREIKSRNVNVICMLKDMPRIKYGYNGASYRLSELYSVVKKNIGKSDIITSVLVDCDGLPTRIVFVHNRNNKREWLAILSTNTSISEEEIVQIYGIRWDIEVYFKMCKSFLGLAKEFQLRSYDGMVAHTTIVCMRYMLLSVENRDNNDDRTAGGIFYDLCAEVERISFAHALGLLLILLAQSLADRLSLPAETINDFLKQFATLIPSYLNAGLGIVTTA